MKKYREYAKKNPGNRKDRKKSSDESESKKTPYEGDILSTVDENLGLIKKIIGANTGLIGEKINIFEGKIQAGIAYIKGMADEELINLHVLMPLLKSSITLVNDENDTFNFIHTQIISVVDVQKTSLMKQVVEGLLNGDSALFINEMDTVLIIKSRKINQRQVDKPDNESTIFSNKESFIEDLGTNCAMIIKRLPTPALHFEAFTVGQFSRTKVKLLWLEGIANPECIDEAKRRIERINMDVVEGIGVLSGLIEDKPFSVFAKYIQTERPDMVTKKLSDGCFAVLCDNSPFALIAPVSFWDTFVSMDDYAERTIISSFLRIVRYLAFFFAIMISPIYLSFVAYNHAIVPSPLAVNIAAGREGVPMPSVVELLSMTFIIDIIREAGLRMPGMVGYFIGTLGGIVLGQAAVSAGYVSSSLIVVISVTTVSTFAIASSNRANTARILNYFLILLSGFFGTLGMVNGLMIIAWHLISLESFGVPYLYPVVPFEWEGWKDLFIRAKFNTLKKRLKLLAPGNRMRVASKDNKNTSGAGRGE